MNELQLFSNEEFGKIRSMLIDNEPWFVGKDVASALGYVNASKAVSNHCKHIRKKVIDVTSQNGNVVKTQTSLINEGDLYRLIIKSKLPSAEKFESWVMDEILPSIRKTGQYNQMPQLTAKDNAILNIINSKDDLTRALAIKDFESIVTEPLITEIDNLKELNNKFKTFIGKDGLIDVDTFSKVLGIKELGRNNMYKWLRDKCYLMRNNFPYQHYINQGLFKLKSVGYRTNYSGESIPLFKVFITKKGIGYILDKLVKDDYIDFSKDYQNY